MQREAHVVLNEKEKKKEKKKSRKGSVPFCVL